MFSLFSGVYDTYLAAPHLNVLVVGASGSGKTALLERLKVTEFAKKPKLPKEQPEELDVPESFLPMALRVPQTALEKQLSTQSLHKKIRKKKKKAAANKPRRGLLACPAPSKYNKEDSSSDEEDNDDDDDVNEKEVPVPQANGDMGRTSSMDLSLRDVPLGDSESFVNHSENIPEKEESPEAQDDDAEDDDNQEYDLKSKSRMLPLHKIRPTSTFLFVALILSYCCAGIRISDLVLISFFCLGTPIASAQH